MVARPDIDRAFEVLCLRSRAAVLHGGSNQQPEKVIHRTHNPRRWKSYSSVASDIAASLGRLGFDQVDLLSEGMDLAGKLREKGIDWVWLNTGGVQGHGPMCHGAAALESLGVPYVGHAPTVAALMDDKPLFKSWLQGMGLPTSPFLVWHPSMGAPPSSGDPCLRPLEEAGGGALIAKPASGRASREVLYLESSLRLPEALAEIHGKTRDRVLIEPFLSGREFCVAVAPPWIRLDGCFEQLESPMMLSLVERHLDRDEKVFTSSDFRPIDSQRIQPLDRRKEARLVRQLEVLGERVFEGLGLGFLVRLDLRQDRRGELMILECNPKPDLAACGEDDRGSIIALGLCDLGLAYDDVIACQLGQRMAMAMDRQDGGLIRRGNALEERGAVGEGP